MSPVIFQRKREVDSSFQGLWEMLMLAEVVEIWRDLVRPIKRGMKVIGRSLFVSAILVLVTTALLPMWLGKQELQKRELVLKRAETGFAELIQMEIEKLAKITEATYFNLEIPKIGAKAKVVVNVNAAEEKDYSQALKQGVVHAAGTYLPGMNGSVTLFAHSTDLPVNIGRYNAVFYRLDELVEGDVIVVWFLGERLVYHMEKSWVTDPSDVSVFEKEYGTEKLYLVTCTPRGTTKSRLIVEALPLDS